jgi:hypothetical protein
MLFTYMGLYIPFFYITDYALSIGIDENISFYTLIIMSAGSIPGRVAPPYFADKLVFPFFPLGYNADQIVGATESETLT